MKEITMFPTDANSTPTNVRDALRQLLITYPEADIRNEISAIYSDSDTTTIYTSTNDTLAVPSVKDASAQELYKEDNSETDSSHSSSPVNQTTSHALTLAELIIFRTELCPVMIDSTVPSNHSTRTKCHHGDHCIYSHNRRWTRRNPSICSYSSIICPSINNKERCAQGRTCPYSHNKEEQMYHPNNYKTALCNVFPDCPRRHCPFAHGGHELRPRPRTMMSTEAIQNASTSDFELRCMRPSSFQGYIGTVASPSPLRSNSPVQSPINGHDQTPGVLDSSYPTFQSPFNPAFAMRGNDFHRGANPMPFGSMPPHMVHPGVQFATQFAHQQPQGMGIGFQPTIPMEFGLSSPSNDQDSNKKVPSAAEFRRHRGTALKT